MSEHLLAHQKSYLLLLLFQAKDERLPCGRLKDRLRSKTATKKLGFNAASLHRALGALVESGEVVEKGRPRNAEQQYPARKASYRLTEQGRQRLFASEQYPNMELRMKGAQLNALLAAVRESPFREPAAPEPTSALPPADLGDAILGEFRNLLREKYGHTRMVPIHEVRRRVGERYGAEPARHDVFDAQLHHLRREGRLRMVPISFLGDATVEQLEDSIPGVNETLFYLEPAQDEYIFQ